MALTSESIMAGLVQHGRVKAQEQRDAARKVRGEAEQTEAAARAVMAQGRANGKLSSAEFLSLIKWKLGKAGGSSKFGSKGARFTAWVDQFKDVPVPDDDYDVADLPYEAEFVELEILLARPAAVPASVPAAAVPAAAACDDPSGAVVAALNAEHATEEALEAHMAVLQAQLVRVRRQKQRAVAEDLARAAPGGLAVAAPVVQAVAKRQRRHWELGETLINHGPGRQKSSYHRTGDLGGGYWARSAIQCAGHTPCPF